MGDIVTFKGRDKGFTAMFSGQDLRRFEISEGEFINISGRGKEVTIKVKGGGEQGMMYLGEGCWNALGLITAGKHVQFRKAEAKHAKEVVMSVDGDFTSENDLKSALLSEIVSGGTEIRKLVGVNTLTISVEAVVPEGSFLVDAQTKLIIQKKKGIVSGKERVTSGILGKPKEEWTEKDFFAEVPKITLNSIYGLGGIVDKLKFYVLNPLTKPELAEKINFKPGAVLIYGPAGSGKSSVVYALVNEAAARYVPIASYMLAQKEMLQDALDKILDATCSGSQSTIVHIEDLERLTPQQELSFERGFTSALLKFIKDIENSWSKKTPVVVIAETRLKSNVNMAVMDSGVFKEYIEIDIPNEEARRDILTNKLKDFSGNFNTENLAVMTHGYSGDDLINLINKAIMYSTQREDEEGDKWLYLRDDDFERAMKDITPSALKEFAIEVPKISWADIGGYEETKREMQRVIEWPLKYREEYEAYIGSPPKGLLLFGPPGCGKTLFAKAVANAASASFLSVKGPELTSKYYGESEERIRESFRKAKKASPSIIFFDEIDAIAKKRGETHEATERIVAQLLTEMDGVEQLKDTLVLAATNRIDIIDTAILRPGRFDRLVYLPTPDEDALKAILEVKTNNLPGIKEMNEEEGKELIEEVVTHISEEEKRRRVGAEEAITFLRTLDVRDDDEITEIISKLKVDEDKIRAAKYIGADIEAIVKEAANIAMVEEIEDHKREESDAQKRRGVTLEDFKEAIEKCPPSLPWRDFLTYEAQRIKFRRGA